MNKVIRALVDAVDPLDDVETAHRADVLDWIDSGAQLCRLEKPATPPKHLVSYCVLVDTTAEQVLLVDHRDAERWLPTGGHVDPGEQPAATAKRELREELGIEPNFVETTGGAPVMVTVTPTAGRSEPHVDVSLWFAFAGTVGQSLTPDPGEFADTRWWGFDEVRHGPQTRFDPHLPRFIQKLKLVEVSM